MFFTSIGLYVFFLYYVQIALNKPSGLQVLPGGLFQQRTVLTQLQWRIKNQELCHVPVHRLGRGTSGNFFVLAILTVL